MLIALRAELNFRILVFNAALLLGTAIRFGPVPQGRRSRSIYRAPYAFAMALIAALAALLPARCATIDPTALTIAAMTVRSYDGPGFGELDSMAGPGAP